jgi:hypothetical protein
MAHSTSIAIKAMGLGLCGLCLCGWGLAACANDAARVADAQCQMVGISHASEEYQSCVQAYRLAREQKALSDNYANLAHPDPIPPKRNGLKALSTY